MMQIYHSMKNKKWIYFFAMLAFLIFLINANSIIAKISNGSYQMESVKSNEIKFHDLVYYGFDQINLQNDLAERVYFSGWAFCETTRDNPDKYIAMILKSDQETLKIGGLKTIREDMYNFYRGDKINIKGKMHGFNIIFSTVGLKKGTYDLYVYDKENAKNYGALFTGVRFIKDDKGFRILKNKPIEKFPKVQTVKNMRFEFDSITVKDSEMTFSGWGILEDKTSSKSKVYLEVSDSNGNAYVYRIAQSVRKDIQQAYETEDYLLSGIKGTLDISQILDGLVELRLIVENDGYYRSSQVKQYKYKSEGNVLELISK